MRWDSVKQAYIVTAFNYGGVYVESKVTASGSTFSLVDHGTKNGKRYWHRCSFTLVSSDRREMTCDDSGDGKKWQQTVIGVALKAK